MGRRRRKMNILDADLTLYEIEHRLEETFRAEENVIHTIGDLELSYEDYKYLILKIKGLTKYITRVEVFQQYKLSILTAMVFSVRYGGDIRGVYHSILDVLTHFQQHHVRYVMRICQNVFYDFGLPIYGIRFSSVGDVFHLITIHANLHMNTMENVFQLLDDYYCRGQEYVLEEEICEKINKEILRDSPVISHSSMNLTFSYILKKMYASCFIQHSSLKQLLMEYNQVSSHLVESCYMWYMKYGNQSNRLIKIR